MKKDKKYIYIPFEILSDSELTTDEKLMLSVVNSIPVRDGKKKASNKLLSEWAYLPEWKVDRLIRNLEKKGKLSLKNRQSKEREFEIVLQRNSRSNFNKSVEVTSTDVSKSISNIINNIYIDNKTLIKQDNTECAYKDIYSINKSHSKSSDNSAPDSSFIEVDI